MFSSQRDNIATTGDAKNNAADNASCEAVPRRLIVMPRDDCEGALRTRRRRCASTPHIARWRRDTIPALSGYETIADNGLLAAATQSNKSRRDPARL